VRDEPEMERFLWRAAIAMAALIVVIVISTVAIAFLAGALYLLLCSMPMTPPAAALVVGLVGLGLAALVALAARLVSRRALPPGRTSGSGGSSSNINDIAARLAGLTAQEMLALIRAHPHRAVIVSLLAGLAVGVSAEIRRILKGVVNR